MSVLRSGITNIGLTQLDGKNVVELLAQVHKVKPLSKVIKKKTATPTY